MTKNSTPQAPRRGTVITLGRNTYRITGSERQGAEIICRATIQSGRGARMIHINVREIQAGASK